MGLKEYNKKRDSAKLPNQRQVSHAALDYLSGTLLLAAPWVMHFDASAPATNVSVFVGVVILMMSTMTNYEGGLAHHIPMFIHLNIDVLGIFLVVLPWLLRFKNEVYKPHFIIGRFSVYRNFDSPVFFDSQIEKIRPQDPVRRISCTAETDVSQS